MKIVENNIRSEYVKRITNKYISFAILSVVLLILPFLPRLYNRIALEFNRIKWNSQNISHYSYELDILCRCNYIYTFATIEVHDGQIVSMVDANGKVLELDGLYSEIFIRNGTVEGLFSNIQGEIFKADMLRTMYDRKYGFPTTIILDPSRDWIDDERIYEISNFEVLP